MSRFDWASFLRQWSQEIVQSLDLEREALPRDVLLSEWLGYPGATEEQIIQAETRLGISLPPSYRDFLKVTNGWRQTTPFVSKLWSTDEIEWFTVRNQSWIERLVEASELPSADPSNASVPPVSIPDEDYFVYGNQQDCSKIRVEYLQTALEISEGREAAIYLLNPQVMTQEGEWEAWFLGDWLPGADRYRSFQEMMQAEYENFLELRESSHDLPPSTPGSGSAPLLREAPAVEPIPSPNQETVVLEIAQLRVISPSPTEPPLTANSYSPLFTRAIQQAIPFTLEIQMQVVERDAVQPESQLTYRLECIAYNLETRFQTCLADMTLSTPIGEDLVCTALLPGIVLPQPGLYRLKVQVTPHNQAAAPGFFKVPVLQVV